MKPPFAYYGGKTFDAYTGQGNHSEVRNDRRTEVLWSNRPLRREATLFEEATA